MRKLIVYTIFSLLPCTLTAQRPSDFEAVLIPVYESGAGARGSQWTSIMAIHNSALTEADFAVPVYNSPCRVAAPCPAPVPAGTTVRLHYSPNHQPGILLYEPRSHSEQLHYQLRIRDLSRQLDTWGTEIPVVRQSEFSARPRHLLDVPTSERFRLSVRLYSLSSTPTTVRLQIHTQPQIMSPNPPTAAVQLVDETFVLSRTPRPRESSAFPFHPAFVAIHDLTGRYPALRDHELVRVAIMPADFSTPVWGFITVTNNETQHVTTIAPQPQ